NIDTNYPVIVANQTTGIEVKNLNLNIFSSYVTATNVGPSPVFSKICTDTNHASAIITNVNQMTAIGMHNLTCTITKENGLSRSVNISIEIFNREYVYNYNGYYSTFVAPKTGYYNLEAWGASGGNSVGNDSNACPVGTSYGSGCGGGGSYAQGAILLNQGETIYVYVGSRGKDGIVSGIAPGGYNGGGNGEYDHSDNEAGGGGGGATDFRLVSGSWNYSTGLRSRIMVAAGGGGASDIYPGGPGGALSSVVTRFSPPATQTSGNAFGIGQNAIYHTANIESGGGGGGYYGGYSYASDPANNGSYGHTGTGGSSFISGCVGCNAVNSSGVHTGNSTHYSGKVFTNIIMKSGLEEMPVQMGPGTTVGNHGNGFAKITYLGNNSLGIGENVEYVHNGSTQTFVSPVTGKYKLEVWGASGGGYTSSYATNGGRGGYSVGTVNLNVGTILYIYAGGEGGYNNTNGGFNGGGNSKSYGGSGGGASDIRIGTDSLYSRVIVAGGGGGAGYTTRIGGYGGGTYGGDGDPGTATPGGGGTSTSGGTTGSTGVIGVFGGAQDRSSGAGGGGGGGWYGGGSGMSSGSDSGGGGGSGYVYTSATASQCPSGCLLVPSYYLSGASTYRGNTTFLSPEGNNAVGHTGNGYVRITLISQS
ncbi:MAG: glycine rich domain-containing protein, partial [Bacilli bacterium]|nr:glycine rich domain-containing protein [Bacilli bacterium]